MPPWELAVRPSAWRQFALIAMEAEAGAENARNTQAGAASAAGRNRN